MSKNKDTKNQTQKKIYRIIYILLILSIGTVVLVKKYRVPKKKSRLIPNPTGFKKRKALSPSKLIFDKNRKFVTLEEIKNLFKELGVEYANHTKFEGKYAVFLKAKKEDYLEYAKKPKSYDSLATKYDSLVKRGYVAPCYIKWIDDELGYGLFANDDLPAGTLISEYVGEAVHKNDIKNKTWSWKYPSRGAFVDKYPTNLSLNGFRYANETRFINHGEEDVRNCTTEFVYVDGAWRLLYIADKTIPKDKQILVSYGRRYWRKRELLKTE